jgi:hypothetical protein
MKPITMLAALLISLTIGGRVEAQPTTGQQIQIKCKELMNYQDLSHAFSAGFCGGFIDGVIDSQTMQGRAPSFCLPQKGSNGQYVQVFLKYLDNHPQELHKPAALLLVESLVKAFPCGK